MRMLKLLGILLLALATTAHAALEDWDVREALVLDLVNQQRGLHGLGTLLADDRLRAAARAHAMDMAQNDFFSHTGSGGSSVADRATATGYLWTTVGENIAAGQGRVFDPISVDFIESAPLDAARSVMFGTTALDDLSAFDLANGGSGFASWAVVGSGWDDGIWDLWQTAQQAQNQGGGWMGSSGHRANILKAAFTDLGVDYFFESDDAFPDPFPGNLQTYWAQVFAAGDTLTPIPLPAALWLCGSALLMLGQRRCRTCCKRSN